MRRRGARRGREARGRPSDSVVPRRAAPIARSKSRRTCCRLGGRDPLMAAPAGAQVISFDREITLRQLGELGAENIQEQRMGIDEIAVQILKGGGNVADSEN